MPPLTQILLLEREQFCWLYRGYLPLHILNKVRWGRFHHCLYSLLFLSLKWIDNGNCWRASSTSFREKLCLLEATAAPVQVCLTIALSFCLKTELVAHSVLHASNLNSFTLNFSQFSTCPVKILRKIMLLSKYREALLLTTAGTGFHPMMLWSFWHLYAILSSWVLWL